MAADGSVIISTKLDNTGFQKGISNIKSDCSGLQNALKGVASAVAVAFSVQKIVDFGKKCVELGSDIAEVQNVVDTAFRDMSYKIEKFADTAIENFGMSRLAAKRTASTYMAMARSMGINEESASNMAISLTALTGDVASFYNISQELADVKLKSVFTGETETLKDLGVVMTQANLDAYALANGYGKTTSAMTQAELVALRYAYVTNQLSLASGDFIKTQDSWANQTRILSMQWQELMSQLGQGIIKVLTPLLKVLNTILSTIIEIVDSVSQALSSLFGITADNADSAQQSITSVTSDQNDWTDAINTTTKAQKKSLASFDTLNTLQNNTASSSGNSSYPMIDIPDITSDYVQSTQKASAITTFIQDRLAELEEPLENIGETIKNAMPVYENFNKYFLQPLGDFLLGEAARSWEKFIDNFTEFTETLSKSTFFTFLADTWKTVGPVLEQIGEFFISFGNMKFDFVWGATFSGLEHLVRVADGWSNISSALLQGDFQGAVEQIRTMMVDSPKELIGDLVKDAGDAFAGFWGLDTDVIESIDIWGDDISALTKEKVAPFLEQIRALDDAIAGLSLTNKIIDQATVDDIKIKVKSISETILNELDADRNQALATLKPLKEALGEEAYNELLADNQEYYDTMNEKVTNGEKEINSIVSAAQAENRALTEEETQRIIQIRDEMNDTGVRHLSESEIEYNTIMRRLKDNATRISLEQASEIIKNAQKTRDESIAAAEKQYTEQLFEAQRMLDVGAINQEQYDAIALAAEETRKKAVNEANEQYDTINATTVEKLGENAKNIDMETGEIKTKWEVICEDLSSKWSEAWEHITFAWNGFKDGFGSLWSKFWAKIGNIFIDVWNGIVGAAEWCINGLIDILNKFKITLPDWLENIGLGGLAGQTFGFNINKVSFQRAARLQEVPALARGAVIPPNREFLAILGDQRVGTNIEAPEGLLRQIMRDELGETSGNRDITIRFDGNMGQLVRLLKPYLDAEDKRKGIRLVNQSI